MNEYIPLNVLAEAILILKQEAKVYAKNKFDMDSLMVDFSILELKHQHSGLPTLYKILLRHREEITGDHYVAFGIWTETGQRLEI